MAKITIKPEVLASIVNVSGKWAIKMAVASNPDNEQLQPNQISQEQLENNFDEAFKYLEAYVHCYLQNVEDSVL